MNLLGIAWEGFRKYPGSMSEEGCPAKEFLVQPGLPTAWCLFVCGRLPPECKVEATIQHVVGLVVPMLHNACGDQEAHHLRCAAVCGLCSCV